jgi:hypothetical protein
MGRSLRSNQKRRDYNREFRRKRIDRLQALEQEVNHLSTRLFRTQQEFLSTISSLLLQTQQQLQRADEIISILESLLEQQKAEFRLNFQSQQRTYGNLRNQLVQQTLDRLHQTESELHQANAIISSLLSSQLPSCTSKEGKEAAPLIILENVRHLLMKLPNRHSSIALSLIGELTQNLALPNLFLVSLLRWPVMFLVSMSGDSFEHTLLQPSRLLCRESLKREARAYGSVG